MVRLAHFHLFRRYGPERAVQIELVPFGMARLAGANEPDPTPKYIRSLGANAAPEAEVPVPALGPDPTLA